MIRNLHPLTLFLHFVFVLLLAVLFFNPIYLSICAVFGFAILLSFDGLRAVKSIFFYLLIISAVALTNPLFSHNGATALLFVNDTRITLEAILYGAAAGVMISAVIAWFSFFNKVFDSEKLMFLLGGLFPKLALVFSMSLGFVPRFVREFRNISGTQRSIQKSRLKRYLSSFSSVVTRAMENSIITADSMKARGYGLRGRTFFTRFRLSAKDVVYLFTSVLFFVLSAVFQGKAVFYPYFKMAFGVYEALGAGAYAMLCALPIITKVREEIRWKFSISKI